MTYSEHCCTDNEKTAQVPAPYDDIGYFTAQIYISRGAIPLSDATVTISKTENGAVNIIAVIISDEDGKTEQIELSAPNRNLSEQPGNFIPFATYDIEITHPFYYRARINNAQVFGGIETLQELNMVPLPENENPLSERDYTVAPQNL